MQPRLHALVIALSLLIMIVVVDLIRRGRLREEYSLVWFFSAAVILFFSVFKGSLTFIADLIQVEYAPSFIFMVAIALVMLVQMYHSMAISRLTSQSRDLAQQLSILRLFLQQLSYQFSERLGTEMREIPLENLHYIQRELSNSHYLPELAQRSLELTLSLFGASSGNLVMLDENGKLIDNALFYEGKMANGSAHVPEDTVEKGLAGWVLKNRKAALVSNTYEDPRWLKRPWDQSNGRSRSAISAPILTSDRVSGVLTLVQSNAEKFTERDLVLLMAVATVISLASEKIFQKPSQPAGAVVFDGKTANSAANSAMQNNSNLSDERVFPSYEAK